MMQANSSHLLLAYTGMLSALTSDPAGTDLTDADRLERVQKL